MIVSTIYNASLQVKAQKEFEMIYHNNSEVCLTNDYRME